MTTGWCLDGHHTTCRREFTSRRTEQTYRCGCRCHIDPDSGKTKGLS